MNILLLEDDIALSDIIAEYLHDNSFMVDVVYDGEEALSQAYERSYDLYAFDVNVPAIKGFDLLKILRDNGDTTPAIFITSLNDIEDVSEGFQSGADDYLKKPFELAELLLRIKNIQKRSFAQQRSSVIKIDKNVVFDIDTELLIVDGQSIALPPKELKALKYFLQHINTIVSFEDLYRIMWNYDESATAESLRAHIKNLRKYFAPDTIQNLRGSGYRFVIKADN
ncbi:MAG: Two-component system response regulator [Campylobacterota bacterium]|nr:Two-component system response regulator [Campylobacterota bacterium]MDQ1340599.1 Two-component system response regulator [Campylobacterota bacterium]